MDTVRAMAQVVRHRPLTEEARVSICWVFGAQRGTSRPTRFSLSSSVLPCQYHSTVALHIRISGG
jgi:hypothetical protein